LHRLGEGPGGPLPRERAFPVQQGRLECSFPTEEEAWAWCAEQAARRKQGHEVEPPARPQPPSTARSDPRSTRPGMPALEPIARAWHQERYEFTCCHPAVDMEAGVA
jgi:hypothetical protein